MPTGVPRTGPVRVLVCSQGFPRHPADHHASFVLDHARALTAAGAEVRVSCPAGPGLATTDAYPAADADGEPTTVAIRRFRYAPRRFETLAYSGGMHHRARGAGGLVLPLFLLGFLVDVARGARRADVIHAHWWLPSGVVAVLAGRMTGTPVVVQVHGTDAAMAKGPLRWFARWVLRSADAVIAVSEDLAGWVRGVAEVEATVLPMPLRPALADGLHHDPASPPSDGPVLAVGRLVPEKGFDVLIRAAAKAGLPVVVVGDGGQEPVLRRLADDVGADVTFAGPVAPDELGPHYRAARLVAVPSHREGFGLVAAEALANGRAVVASAVGGLAQVVADGVTGRLVPAGDVEALADALATTDPALGAAGPASITWIAPERIGPATLDVYLRVLEVR
ncbi:MAG TPA: glycosyltransferase [Acidimicrobiales bacterium]|nr:glycosyltransferase [Acidimicrobiales bacterium]